MTRKSAPLKGVRIIDMTTVMLGPYATQMMGDYGADVVKVEAPGGDTTRGIGPAREIGMAATFVGANRSKRSVVLDLKQGGGRQALLALVRTADVLIYSMRPQKLVELGLGPEVLRNINPRLIVVAVHGFAEGGPYAGRPAYDDIIQGLSGLASLSEMRGGEPEYMPTVVADKTCALFATQALLAALYARERTGKGCVVEVPMLESMVNFALVEHFYGAHFAPSLGGFGYTRLLTLWRRPYKTADGYVCVVPYTDKHWMRFFKEAGREDLLQDERFSTVSGRTQHIDMLYGELARAMPGRTTQAWLEAFERLDIPAAPMRGLAELQTDPHLASTGFFIKMQDPAMGTLTMPNAPLKFDGEAAQPTLPPPRLGEHTVELLREAGMAQDAIHALLRSKAAVQHNNYTETES